MFGIGFILGPVIGGLLGGIDLRLPFFVAGGLALVNLAYGYFVLPESCRPQRRRWTGAPIRCRSLRQLAR
jgi:DHA1 family tetracycline resistance protein-like MFS transporter